MGTLCVTCGTLRTPKKSGPPREKAPKNYLTCGHSNNGQNVIHGKRKVTIRVASLTGELRLCVGTRTWNRPLWLVILALFTSKLKKLRLPVAFVRRPMCARNVCLILTRIMVPGVARVKMSGVCLSGV